MTLRDLVVAWLASGATIATGGWVLDERERKGVPRWFWVGLAVLAGPLVAAAAMWTKCRCRWGVHAWAHRATERVEMPYGADTREVFRCRLCGAVRRSASRYSGC